MSHRPRCHCQSCTIRGFIGPAVVITVGVLWLLNETQGGRLYFDNTWPVILIVIGLLLLASSMASRQGHAELQSPPVTPPAPPVPPAPPAPSAQTPYSAQGQ